MRRSLAWVLAAAPAVMLVEPAAAQAVAVTVDATRTSPPISKLVFGGFMEPATTRVWAEMLQDRKFFNRVTSQPDPSRRAAGSAAGDHSGGGGPSVPTRSSRWTRRMRTSANGPRA